MKQSPQNPALVEPLSSAREARLWHLEAVDAVYRAMGSTLDPVESIKLGLAALRKSLELDRVGLHRFDDPEPGFLRVRFIDTGADWPTIAPDTALTLRVAGNSLREKQLRGPASAEPVALDLTELLGSETLQRLGTCTIVGVGLMPLGERPWLLDAHRCRDSPPLGEREVAVLRDVGRRLTLELSAMAHTEKLAAQVAQLNLTREHALEFAKMSALSSMVAGVAHHFNNLLAGVLGNIYVLEDLGERDPAERDALADMRDSGERAADLVRQLMTFARKGPTSVTERDLSALVRSTVETMDLATPRHVRVEGDVPDDEMVALVDVRAVQEIILNLVTNARQAFEPDAVAVVRVNLGSVPASEDEAERAPHGWAVLTVADKGVGIPADVLPHIFEPFFTTREVGSGVGMGLSTVYGSVQRMGGDVHVESELGQGTRVQVRIPLVGELLVHTPPDASVLPGHGETILVVDDDETVRTVLARVLKHLGYEAVVCAAADEAIATFAQDPQRFDAVLSDVIMPDRDGYELASALRGLRANIPVLLMTSYDPEGLQGLAGVPGEVPRVLEKPINMRKLAGALARALS